MPKMSKWEAVKILEDCLYYWHTIDYADGKQALTVLSQPDGLVEELEKLIKSHKQITIYRDNRGQIGFDMEDSHGRQELALHTKTLTEAIQKAVKVAEDKKERRGR